MEKTLTGFDLEGALERDVEEELAVEAESGVAYPEAGTDMVDQDKAGCESREVRRRACPRRRQRRRLRPSNRTTMDSSTRR